MMDISESFLKYSETSTDKGRVFQNDWKIKKKKPSILSFLIAYQECKSEEVSK